MRPRPVEGIGIGLRREFAHDLLATSRRVDWIEVTPENWVTFGGERKRLLDACVDRWPTILHGVSLSVGGPDPLDVSFLSAVRELGTRARSAWWSDHLCYATAGGAHLHDLFPLPFTEEAVAHVAARARESQERAGLPLLLENVTFYAHMPGGTLDEADFLATVVESSGCDLLLDVNNVYVNARNHGFDPESFLTRLPLDRVRQLHLAGHTRYDDVVIDTHIGPVPEPVWSLYRFTLARAGRLIPTLIEWDQDIPAVDVVLDEVDRARAVAAEALS